MRHELFLSFFMFLLVSSKLPGKVQCRIWKGGKVDVICASEMLQKWKTDFRGNERERDRIIDEMDSYIKPRFG
ncbi:hypothetical protein X798_02229 [Onchocerca flexuosa]|uniref:Uncharacterized protein n=1 Tax=Onchocerca flexuosa TaxID=387005 RepID=A0A238C105_9BILA|nr:hypothetical protein X798_02229 [Onchocerca flexuosa]